MKGTDSETLCEPSSAWTSGQPALAPQDRRCPGCGAEPPRTPKPSGFISGASAGACRPCPRVCPAQLLRAGGGVIPGWLWGSWRTSRPVLRFPTITMDTYGSSGLSIPYIRHLPVSRPEPPPAGIGSSHPCPTKPENRTWKAPSGSAKAQSRAKARPPPVSAHEHRVFFSSWRNKHQNCMKLRLWCPGIQFD